MVFPQLRQQRRMGRISGRSWSCVFRRCAHLPRLSHCGLGGNFNRIRPGEQLSMARYASWLLPWVVAVSLICCQRTPNAVTSQALATTLADVKSAGSGPPDGRKGTEEDGGGTDNVDVSVAADYDIPDAFLTIQDADSEAQGDAKAADTKTSQDLPAEDSFDSLSDISHAADVPELDSMKADVASSDSSEGCGDTIQWMKIPEVPQGKCWQNLASATHMWHCNTSFSQCCMAPIGAGPCGWYRCCNNAFKDLTRAELPSPGVCDNPKCGLVSQGAWASTFCPPLQDMKSAIDAGIMLIDCKPYPKCCPKVTWEAK